MKRPLFLLESVPAGFKPPGGAELFALTPRACWQMEKQGIPYRTLSAMGTEDRLRQRQEGYFREQLDWFRQIDQMLIERHPELKSSAVAPCLLYGYKLKTLLDDTLIRSTECAALLKLAPERVIFFGERGTYSRILSGLCAEQDIPFEQRLLPARPHSADGWKRFLRPLVHLIRYGFRRVCHQRWRISPNSPKRLTLLFLETGHDLNDLLNSALRAGHRCFIRPAVRTRRNTQKTWNTTAEELFGESSPLWNGIRQTGNLPIEKFLAEPLKTWVRSELCSTAALAEGYRDFYRREKVDFVVTSALVSLPHTAAISACDPVGKPQAVLIAHGDGAEIKPAWDLFELAPYQHYFVPSSEFAEYFEGRRSLVPFPTARVHVGSYRWRNYRRLAHKRGSPPEPIPAGKPVVVVPLCQPETDRRYLNPLGYSETGYYHLQQQLLRVCAEFPQYTFVIKLFPPQPEKNSAVAKAAARLGASNWVISSAPFSRWLPWADRVLLDWPSTPLYETALAGVPFHLLLSTRHLILRPTAGAPWKEFYSCFSTSEEAEQAVRQFLRSPASPPPPLPLEGEEILSQLLSLKTTTAENVEVRLLSAAQALRERVPSDRGSWLYLGKNKRWASRLKAHFDPIEPTPIEAVFDQAADQLRHPFLDFVAEVGRRQADPITWWSTRFSWKSWNTSDFFLLLCYLQTAQKAAQHAIAQKRSLLLILEDPWLLRQLQENLRGQPGVKTGRRRSLLFEKGTCRVLGLLRRFKWFSKTLRGMLRLRWRWPFQNRPISSEPTAALFMAPQKRVFAHPRTWHEPYLADIDRWLKESGYRVLRFCLPEASSGFEKELSQRSDSCHPLILEATFRMLIRACRMRWTPRWPAEMTLQKMPIRFLCSREAWLEQAQAGLCNYRLFYDCFDRFLMKAKIRSVVTFYENQPWEKLAVHAARGRQVGTVAIQNALFSRFHLSYFCGNGNADQVPLPDVLCTSGPEAERLLREGGLPPQVLHPCGALRYPGHSNGFSVPESSAQRNRVLVALSIDPEMSRHLLQALEEVFPDGGQAEGLRFILRPHPMGPVPLKAIRFETAFCDPHKTTVPDALKECDLVLFSGSTIGFDALSHHREAVRFRSELLPDYDQNYAETCPVVTQRQLKTWLLSWRRGKIAPLFQDPRPVLSEFFAPLDPSALQTAFRRALERARMRPSKLLERTPHSTQTRLGMELLDRNERTVDFPESVMADLRNRITPFSLRAYPEPEPLYRKLVQWLGVDRDRLLLSAGADGALKMIFDAYLEPGQTIVTVTPSYGMIPVYGRLAGADNREVGFNSRLELDFGKVLDALDSKVRFVLLANPNQPVEQVYTKEQVEQLLRACERVGALLVMDEAYYPFGATTALPWVERSDRLLVVRSFSKAFGLAGLRLGYLVAQSRRIQELNQFRPPFETHAMAVAAGCYMLDHESLMWDYVREVRRSVQFLTVSLQRQGIPATGGWTNAVLVPLPASHPAGLLAERLKQRNVLVKTECRPPLSNHLRITVGSLPQTEQFLESFLEVLKNR